MNNRIFIKNGIILTLGEHGKVLDGHALLIEGGLIKKVAPFNKFKKEEIEKSQVIDAENKIVMPGFINTHTHAYSSFALGLNNIAPSKNFSEVLINLWWRLDKLLTFDDILYSAYLTCINSIKHGVTTLFDHHSSPNNVTGSLETISRAFKDTGLRGSICYEVSCRDGKDIAKKGIDENINFIKSNKNSMITPLFGMHASFTIDDDIMENISEVVKDLNVGIHIHAAEDRVDQEITLKNCSRQVVERLNSYNLLGRNSICAHGVHLNDDEIKLLKSSETMVIHNPQSNMNNAVGIMNLMKLHSEGILIGLGTDAMTSNMLEELRVALWLYKLNNKNPGSGFHEVTSLLLNNKKIADRLGFNIGEIKVGKNADIILIDYIPSTPLSTENYLSHLLFGIYQSTVNTTIINGKVLMHNRLFLDISEEEISKKSQVLAKKIWNRF